MRAFILLCFFSSIGFSQTEKSETSNDLNVSLTEFQEALKHQQTLKSYLGTTEILESTEKLKDIISKIKPAIQWIHDYFLPTFFSQYQYCKAEAEKQKEKARESLKEHLKSPNPTFLTNWESDIEQEFTKLKPHADFCFDKNVHLIIYHNSIHLLELLKIDIKKNENKNEIIKKFQSFFDYFFISQGVTYLLADDFIDFLEQNLIFLLRKINTTLEQESLPWRQQQNVIAALENSRDRLSPSVRNTLDDLLNNYNKKMNPPHPGQPHQSSSKLTNLKTERFR